MRFKFHPEALAEVDEAMEWYRDISEKLPPRFHQELKRQLELACKFPEIFPRYGTYRKINLTTFPYLIFYEICANHIQIIGVFHGYRDPKFIAKKISSR